VRGGGDDLLEDRLVRQVGQIERGELSDALERLGDVGTLNDGAVAGRDRRDVEVLHLSTCLPYLA
jgi:hypothetical protein